MELYGSVHEPGAGRLLGLLYRGIVFILGGELARIVQVHRSHGSRPGWSFREVSP